MAVGRGAGEVLPTGRCTRVRCGVEEEEEEEATRWALPVSRFAAAKSLRVGVGWTSSFPVLLAFSEGMASWEGEMGGRPKEGKLEKGRKHESSVVEGEECEGVEGRIASARLDSIFFASRKSCTGVPASCATLPVEDTETWEGGEDTLTASAMTRREVLDDEVEEVTRFVFLSTLCLAGLPLGGVRVEEDA